MAGLRESFSQNPLLSLLVLVGFGLVVFQMVGLFTGKAFSISGIILTIVVFVAIAGLIIVVKGARAGETFKLENFILIIGAGAGIFFLLPFLSGIGSFSFFDQPIQEIQSFTVGGFPLITVLLIVAVGVLVYRDKNLRRKIGLV